MCNTCMSIVINSISRIGGSFIFYARVGANIFALIFLLIFHVFGL
uniref:Uncharacterized protein n=1 Tax=Lepeophtheirus salmonis TaxID=72036 RepID=A0A0K2TZP7_LEPSM